MNNSSPPIQFGLDTFGDMAVDSKGQPLTAGQVIRNVVAQAQLADELGIDAFNVGEHHRDDFAISAPEVVLAGIASVTRHITLGSAVTVLSSDDPVRVYERFATLDALSGGRAEITAGRGSFTESYTLFGFDLSDYEELFEERFALLLQLRKEGPVTWSGNTRSPLKDQQVYPKTERGRLRIRRGVGGSPESVVRAASAGVPLVLAIIGGNAARFAPYAELYRKSLKEFGKDPLPLSIHSPGHLADSDEQAMEELWPHYKTSFGRIGRERGWGQITREHFLEEIADGSLYVGSPRSVARKMAKALKSLRAQRFDLKYATGPMPHELLINSIRLYATEVVPLVRELLSR